MDALATRRGAETFGRVPQRISGSAKVHHLIIGGGLGVRYREGQEAPSQRITWHNCLPDERLRQYEIFVEPGRAIAANAGILVTEVEFLKLAEYKNFAVVDAAMNDLIRPALYSAWQEIIPVIPREGETAPTTS